MTTPLCYCVRLWARSPSCISVTPSLSSRLMADPHASAGNHDREDPISWNSQEVEFSESVETIGSMAYRRAHCVNLPCCLSFSRRQVTDMIIGLSPLGITLGGGGAAPPACFRGHD